MPLPADGHVHSEWSWDTADGSMEQTCRRAVELGVPAVAFTEHVDILDWAVEGAEPDELGVMGKHLGPDSKLHPPPLDVDGYLACVERCRVRFPELRILTGVEFGEPHRCGDELDRLLGTGAFDRVNGSLHLLPVGERFLDPYSLLDLWAAEKIVREYVPELVRMLDGSDRFEVLCHIDFPLRTWPSEAGPFDPHDFEEEFRYVMRVAAQSGRALEYNTSHANPWIIPWWREEGGRAVSFGSDAHEPGRVAQGFDAARALAENSGFGPGSRPNDFWTW